MTIHITINDKEVRDFLKKGQKLPVWIRESIMNWGFTLQQDLRIAAPGYTGKLASGINWKERGNTFQLEMPIEGVYVDSTRTHWVSLNKSNARNKRLAEWALNHGIAKERNGYVTPGSLLVHKHPFITRVVNRDVLKLDNHLRRGLNKLK